jgi:Ca2+-binding EF-hand superfamily protein
MNSCLRDKTSKYKNEIKSNFKSYNNNKKESIQTKNFNDILNVVNSNKKNKFINDSIKSLISIKQEENDDNISPEEYISFIENKLENNETNDGLKNIFNALCDSNNEKISWNSLPQIAKELGDDEMSNNLMNVIKQSKLYLKDLNYEEFLEIMNSESDEEKEDIKLKSKKDNINNNINYKNEDDDDEEENIKINDYINNYEQKPIYKQKKIPKNKNKEYDDEITSSSQSINKISDDIIIEEKSEDTKTNENNEISNDNEKIYKRYHRRYRSKKTPSNNNENNNTENINYNHKSLNKYRKKHSYH